MGGNDTRQIWGKTQENTQQMRKEECVSVGNMVSER